MYRLQAGKSLDQGSKNYQLYEMARCFTDQGTSFTKTKSIGKDEEIDNVT